MNMTTVNLFGGIALCDFGAAGLIETVFDLRRWRAARDWPVAEGRVVYSQLEEQGAWQGEYTEKLKFGYEFTVDGHTHTGHRIRAGQELDLTVGTGPDSAWSSARTDANRYPSGAHVLVRYDPHNPDKCCLQQGGLSGILFKMGVCTALLLAGGAMLRTSLG